MQYNSYGTVCSNKTCSNLLLFALFATCIFFGKADFGLASPGATATDNNLTLLTAGHTICFDSHTGEWNCGTLYGGVDPSVSHSFLLRNDGSSPIVISRLMPSCGCTTAIATGPKSSTLPCLLLPGQEATVVVTVAADHLVPGPLAKSVSVFASSSSPVAKLFMVGVFRSAVTFTPPALDFGNVQLGQTREVLLTLTLAPGMMPSNAQTILASESNTLDYSDIKVETLLGAFGKLLKADGLSRTYLLTFQPKRRIGLIDGEVTFSTAGHDAALDKMLQLYTLVATVGAENTIC